MARRDLTGAVDFTVLEAMTAGMDDVTEEVLGLFAERARSRGGKLQVRFRVSGDRSVLEVQDDGPGPDEELARGGVGRTLMGAFAKQLRGETEFKSPPGGGTIARMIFATPEALAPVDPADKTPGTAALASR